MPINLGLEKALVTINRTLIRETLDLYHQIDECFGCPLEPIKRLIGPGPEDVILDTRFKSTIELRNSANRSCRIDNLQLNNHGHYQLDVSPNSGITNGNFDCNIKTLDGGDCDLCPIAVFLCFLILVSFAERFWSKISCRKGADGPGYEAENVKRQQQSPSLGSEENDDGQLNVNTVSENQDNQSEHEQPNDKVKQNLRYDCLDAFRGLTIAGMIMVNNGGAGYPMLEHAPWDGITVADFVFPFFIFSMGASIAISMKSFLEREGPFFGCFVQKILRRSLTLLLIGICYNSISLGPDTSLHHLRLSGVLQRLAVSYFVVALMYGVKLTLNKWIKAQSLYRIPHLSNVIGVLIELLTALNFLGLYLYVSLYLDYSSSCPPGYLGPGGQTEGSKYLNCTGGAAAWLDHQVLGESHMYNDRNLQEIFKTKVTHDPEGLLGYTTSILLTIVGLQCGKILTDFKMHKTRLLMLLQWIATLTIIAMLSVLRIPINKRLWSISFVATTGAVAFLLMALLYIWLDFYTCRRTYILRLLISAGRNSLLLYIGHSIITGMLPWYFAVDNSSHLQLLIRLIWCTYVWLLIGDYLNSRKLYLKL